MADHAGRTSAQCPASPDGGGDGRVRPCHRPRGNALLSWCWPAHHRALSRPADLDGIFVPSKRRILDQPVPRLCPLVPRFQPQSARGTLSRTSPLVAGKISTATVITVTQLRHGFETPTGFVDVL